MVFLSDTGLPEVAQRYRGFASVLENAIPRLPCQCSTTSFLAESGREAMLDLIRVNPDLDAVFASSDLLAVAAIGALRESGRRVPHDVVVVGYDVDLATCFNLSITTVRQPIVDGERLMADTLLGILQGESITSPDVLETQLIVRESSRGKTASEATGADAGAPVARDRLAAASAGA